MARRRAPTNLLEVGRLPVQNPASRHLEGCICREGAHGSGQASHQGEERTSSEFGITVVDFHLQRLLRTEALDLLGRRKRHFNSGIGIEEGMLDHILNLGVVTDLLDGSCLYMVFGAGNGELL